MIQRSTSLKHRIERETVRHAGSLARLVFFKGEMPVRCEFSADGERIASMPAPEAIVRSIVQGEEPHMVTDANYWRLMDNNGNVVCQGNGK